MSDPWKQGVGNGADTGMASRLLLEALKGGGGLPSLLTLLSQAPLSAEQRGILELLHTLQNGDTADAAEPSRAAHAGPPECDSDAGNEDAAETVADENELQALKQEIADLREVNDTAAAALGACPACWGGDADCPLCSGHGQAGSAAPDPRLFDALVVPAVRRMHAARQARGHPGPARARSHHPFRTEAYR